ncbi:MAG: acetyl-CoA C-acetyltransferase [Deltaproteobacteria bacterium]|nr:acetyl-CoA C-acetyltransferase [Deltaproteobacteria bacterium]
MRKVVIVSGARTAVGNFGGSLKDVPVVKLGSTVLKAALKKASVRPATSDGVRRLGPAALAEQGTIDLEKAGHDYDGSLQPIHVDEVIMGNVVGAGQGQNVARQASIGAGLPRETTAFTINKICGSGLKAVALGAQSILAGEADVVLAGGMENMSQIPYALPAGRWGARMNNVELVDLMVHDGLWEKFYGYHMGLTAENLQAMYQISRQEQDELSATSHARARKAIADGTFKEEIAPVVIPQKRGDPIIFDTDERPMDTTVEKMAKLPPAFKKDGTVTAGNASGINDAAAALLLMSEEKAQELGLKPLARILGYAAGGVDPQYMGIGPVPAVRKLLQRTGATTGDLNLVELNEAFAVQALACVRELNLDLEKTNVHGSGVSIGHPIGCTGARILVTLIHELRRRRGNTGLAGLCIGGGMGIAMMVETV